MLVLKPELRCRRCAAPLPPGPSGVAVHARIALDRQCDACGLRALYAASGS